MATVKGVSGLVLLPARNYEWELRQRATISVPRAGKISEILGEKELSGGLKIAGEDDFSIFDGNVLLLWELVRVLFAEARYPSLQDDECFNVVALEVTDDEILVHGEVICALEE